MQGSQNAKWRTKVHLRGKLKLLRLLACVCMATIVDDCKIFRAIVLVAKVGHFFLQCGIPTFGGNLVVLRLEFEFGLE